VLDTETATDKAMEEALAIANEAFVVSASGAGIATGVANAATTEAEPTSVEATDGDFGGAVTDEGEHTGDGGASSTQSPPDRSSTIAIDEAPSYTEDGEAPEATTVAKGRAESANGADDATIVDETITADEPSDGAALDARAADDWATTGNATNAGEATTPAEEAPATDERVIGEDGTIAPDATTTEDEADATHSFATDEGKTMHGWFSTADVVTADGSTATAEEADDESVGTGDGASGVGGLRIGDGLGGTDLVIAGEAATVDEWSGPADVVTADGSTATAEEADDESVGMGDGPSGAGGLRIGDGLGGTDLVIAGEAATVDQSSGTADVIAEDDSTTIAPDAAAADLVIAGEAATVDQPSGRADVIAEDDSTTIAPDAAATGLVIAGEAATVDEWSGPGDVVTADGSTATADEVSDESVGTGDGASGAGGLRIGDGLGATDLVIAGEAATADQPSGTADLLAEDDSTTIAPDAAATTDQPSDTDEAATEGSVTMTAGEAVAPDRAVTSDEPRTPDQAGITNAPTTVDDTTTIIPAIPDDIPVVPPLGRLRVADQSAFRESGKQTPRSGAGASTLDAPTTSATETVGPKPAAVPVTLPAPAPAPATPVRRRPRRARLKVTRTDPWSVMKIAFILSLAAGIMTVVAVAFLWMALDAAGVFSKVGETVNSVTSGGADKGFDLEGYLTLSRVLGITGIIAAVEVVVMTALATLLAFMYNVSSGMVGGVEVTLAEDD
jgi:hypothetical protein